MNKSLALCSPVQNWSVRDAVNTNPPATGTRLSEGPLDGNSSKSLPTEDESAAFIRSHPHQQPIIANSDLGQFASTLCHSPVASAAASEDSMSERTEELTPPESPVKAQSPNAGATAECVGRLSLEQDYCRDRHQSHSRGRSMTSGPHAMVSKRAASKELSPQKGCRSARYDECPKPRQSPRSSQVSGRAQRRGVSDRQTLVRVRSGEARRCESTVALPHPVLNKLKQPNRVDSGYGGSLSSPRSTVCYLKTGPQNAPTTTLSTAIPEHALPPPAPSPRRLVSRPVDSKYPGLILQPDSSPISLKQLADEIKGIYAGLVMVEAKCMSIDKAQADDPKSHLGPEQWQALIALHRTLLYEHHDFLMATQHPAATEALRGLATKYSMPARMWRHGIHAFLEVLRHRRPASQDYMLSFIYLAYQMMALLLETVPSFTDTWIECLGDLARYRMAIEEEKEAHATWGGVAARWYTLASDRHPTTGRLYHHLGILERPSLRKLSFYAKSLTCVQPFANAMDSLRTLCAPIVQDERSIQSSSHSTEARIVTFYALNFSHGASEKTDAIGTHALELLCKQPLKICELGAHLCVTSISALFDFGEQSNFLLKLYSTTIDHATHSDGNASSSHQYDIPSVYSDPKSPALLSSYRFLSATFDLVVRRLHLLGPLRDCLPYVHIMLVWLHSYHTLQHRLDLSFESLPLDLGLLNWQGLARFLNCLIHEQPVTARILECALAREGTFMVTECKGVPARPLPEDDLIRGLVWGHFYFPSDWFDDQTEDDGRAIEDEYTYKARTERVLWLGMYLAIHTEHLHFDVKERVFEVGSSKNSATPNHSDGQLRAKSPGQAACPVEPAQEIEPVVSSSENSEDGYTIVKKPRTANSGLPPHPQKPLGSSWADVASVKSKPCSRTTSAAQKGRQMKLNADKFRIAGEYVGMDSEMDGEGRFGEIREGYASFR